MASAADEWVSLFILEEWVSLLVPLRSGCHSWFPLTDVKKNESDFYKIE